MGVCSALLNVHPSPFILSCPAEVEIPMVWGEGGGREGSRTKDCLCVCAVVVVVVALEKVVANKRRVYVCAGKVDTKKEEVTTNSRRRKKEFLLDGALAEEGEVDGTGDDLESVVDGDDGPLEGGGRSFGYGHGGWGGVVGVVERESS